MRREREMNGLSITLRDIIEETQEASGRAQTYGDADKCLKLLDRLHQLEKRIEETLVFLEPAGDNNFSAGLIHALRKIWGTDPPSELISSEVAKATRLILDGLHTDGAHHKQWYLEQIGELMGLGVTMQMEFEREKKEGKGWERGIPP